MMGFPPTEKAITSIRMTKTVTVALCLFAVSLALGRAAEPVSKYEKKVRAFEKLDEAKMPPKGVVLFLGSSSIEMWKNLAADFPNHTVIQRGIGGTQISDMIEFADRIAIPYAPSKIVFYAGDNDIAAKESPESVLADYKKFVGKIHEALPETEIYFLAIKPSPSRWHLGVQGAQANELIRTFSKKNPKLHYIDVATPLMGPTAQPDPAYFIEDKLHLNRKGYEAWARVVNQALK